MTTSIRPTPPLARISICQASSERPEKSIGCARHASIERAVAVVVAMTVAMIFLVRYGALGIAWAVAVGGVVSFLALGFMARRTLNGMEHRVA